MEILAALGTKAMQSDIDKGYAMRMRPPLSNTEAAPVGLDHRNIEKGNIAAIGNQ